MLDKRFYRVFLWGWCKMCGAHIICPHCGTNTCSGGFGNEDGTSVGEDSTSGKCKVCNLAYQYAHLCYEHGLQPKTKREVNALNKKIMKKDGYKERYVA